MKLQLVILLVCTTLTLLAESTSNEITFSALRYERDLKNQISRGIGKAWVKRGEVLLEADELEIDYKTNEATAIGNVHFKQGIIDMYADRGSYALSGERATMYNATIINEKMVFTGKVIRRLSRDYFEMEEGLYTNCNTQPVRDRSVRQCYFDWKIYGRRFDILVEGYLNAYDAILYAKDLPVAYLPYYRAPAKAKRQSGFLYPQFIARDDIKGSGASIPYYLTLGESQDLTLSPDIYTKIGYHIGTNYRYAYSSTKAGEMNFYFTQKRFGPNREEPFNMFRDNGRNFGVLGEWFLTAGNSYDLGGEDRSTQTLSIVSDPYYARMFEADLGNQSYMGYLRSQVTVSLPRENWLYTGLARYDQSLIMTKDNETDKGSVAQLPSLGLFKKNTTLLNYFSYDFDARLNNYSRFGKAFDKVPDPSTGLPDTSPALDGNDYIREGRRLQLEPRLVLNLPLPRGFEMLPELRAGNLLYHFDYGESNFVNRQYVDLQLPISLYLSKRFSTDISGLEEVRHVFRPKITYTNALYRSEDPTHQFFYSNKKEGLANPRFDALDYVQKYHYGRLDFENSLYRRTAAGYEQFLTFSLGQQYNITLIDSTDLTTNVYSDAIGPIQSSLLITLGRFSFQTQANYRLQKSDVYNDPDPNNKSRVVIDTKHNYEISSTLAYGSDSGAVSFGSLLRHGGTEYTENSSFTLTGTKILPTFFDITAYIVYSPYQNRLQNFSGTFTFAAKPYSCWKLEVTYALNEAFRNGKWEYNNIVALRFGLSFGGNVVFGL